MRLGLNRFAKPLIEISHGIGRLAIRVLRGTGDLLSPSSALGLNAFFDRRDARRPPLKAIFTHVPSPKFARPGTPERVADREFVPMRTGQGSPQLDAGLGGK
jgi:hypothetical protein